MFTGGVFRVSIDFFDTYKIEYRGPSRVSRGDGNSFGEVCLELGFLSSVLRPPSYSRLVASWLKAGLYALAMAKVV